jgi:hypothetical protein
VATVAVAARNTCFSSSFLERQAQTNILQHITNPTLPSSHPESKHAIHRHISQSAYHPPTKELYILASQQSILIFFNDHVNSHAIPIINFILF